MTENELFAKVCVFLNEFSNLCYDKDPQNTYSDLFDFISSRILTMILANSYKHCKENQHFSTKLSVLEIERKLQNRCSHSAIMRRLRILAHYGFIVVDSEKWDLAKGLRREIQTITPHDAFKNLFDKREDKLRKRFMLNTLAWGMNRPIEETNIRAYKSTQGFHQYTVPYGKKETLENAICLLTTGENFNEQVENKQIAKDQRKEENQKWRELNDQFVQCCADVWVEGQAQDGKGIARPIWEGDTTKLPPAARTERQNLTKQFEEWGGKITALAWLVFCLRNPIRDDKGKIAYDRNTPHLTATFFDKRPSQFVKNFKAILNDSVFDELSREVWPTFEVVLREKFGGFVDIAPRNGATVFEKIGYEFGDSVRTNDLNR